MFNWIGNNWWYSIPPGVLAVAAITFRRIYRKSGEAEISTFGSYILGVVRLSLGRYFSQALARQFGFRQYVRLSYQAFPSHLAVPSVEQIRIDIDSAYVALGLHGTAQTKIQDYEILAMGGGSVLIFGEPGSGKSSLTKKLFREACVDALLWPSSSRLPIHIELRQIPWADGGGVGVSASGRWLYDRITEKVRSVEGVHDPKFVLDAFSAKSGIVVFLDGLDEVPQSQLQFACNAINDVKNQILQKSTRSIVIVTARSQLNAVLPKSFAESFGVVYNIEPFSQADIYGFLQNWPFPGDPATETRRIFKEFRLHPTLAEMCTNPLILSMYIAHDQRYAATDGSPNVRLPDTRTEFYGTVVSELLLFRRSDQMGKRSGGQYLRREREMVLGRIAMHHLMFTDEPANSLSWDDALSLTRDVLNLESTIESDKYLTDMSVDTGIFAEERKGESFRFMHLTLCEYLAASEIVQSGGNYLDTLLDACTTASDGRPFDGNRQRLSEVLIFTLALLPREQRVQTLRNVYESGKADEVIIRALRETQDYRTDLYESAVQNVMAKLRQSNVRNWDGRTLSLMRLTISSLVECHQIGSTVNRRPQLTASTFLDHIVRGDKDRLDVIFDMYLQFSPAEAFSIAIELGASESLRNPSRIVRVMTEPDFVGYAIDRLGESADEERFWSLVLGEAALSRRLVADMLLSERLERDLEESAAGADSKSWYTYGILEGTVYGRVLDLAVMHVETLARGMEIGFPRVGLLTGIRSNENLSTRYYAYPHFRLLCSILIASGALSCLLIVFSGFTQAMIDITWHRIVLLATLGIGLAALGGTVFTSRLARRWRMRHKNANRALRYMYSILGIMRRTWLNSRLDGSQLIVVYLNGTAHVLAPRNARNRTGDLSIDLLIDQKGNVASIDVEDVQKAPNMGVVAAALWPPLRQVCELMDFVATYEDIAIGSEVSSLKATVARGFRHRSLRRRRHIFVKVQR